MQSSGTPETDQYSQCMDDAKKSMTQSFLKLNKELAFLSSDEYSESNFYFRKINMSFEELWSQIRNIFDTVQYGATPEQFSAAVAEFKSIIILLIQAGIPVEMGKNLNFWSTQFGRMEAEVFSTKTQGTTDSQATAYLRKIFLEWPEEKITVFLPMVTATKPLFPKVSLLYWTAISDFCLDYIFDSVGKNLESHVFFQDSLTIGNYFWNVELPKAREKDLKLIIHVFDAEKGTWGAPIKMDSAEADNITIRRRMLHPLDEKVHPDHIVESTLLKDKLWKKEYHDDAKLKFWAAPKILTIGKLKEIAKKIKLKPK